MSTYPIVLAHGIARFDFVARELDLLDGVESDDDSTHYFRRIRSSLRADGFDAHHSDVPFSAGVEVRADALRADLERILADTGAPRLHVIAHSMGGLDARHMLFAGKDEGFERKVASLTTIGTPHLGTSFADWGVRNSEVLFSLLDFLGIDSLDGFQDLTREACRAFDARAEGFERTCGVRFKTFAGVQDLPRVFAPLQPSWLLIHAEEGPNDGLVALDSARWRPEYFVRRIDADHLNEVGWWEPNELAVAFHRSAAARRRSRREVEQRIRELYLEIARDLAVEFPWDGVR